MKPTRLSWDGKTASIAALIRGLAARTDEAESIAREVIGEVRARGDEALLELSVRFDGVRPQPIVYGPDDLIEARHRTDRAVVVALEQAAENVRVVAEAQLDADPRLVEPEAGQRIRIRQVPVAAAGIYAPGGRASYPSSVVMGVVPARVAGVERIVVASPAGVGGRVADPVLAAASIAGADQLYALGGAQAVAALAYGTESIGPVDVIVGPGGPIVQAAKLLVSRDVGIDGYAGPSELMVLFDDTAELHELALDICAQAEHGDDGLMAACATSGSLLDALLAEVEAVNREDELQRSPLALVEVGSLAAGIALADLLAPEHLQIACKGEEELAGEVRYAGAVFTGRGGATAFGDYIAGSNHVLPTGGAGRFRGPLGPGAFRRALAHVHIDGAAAAALADSVEALARFEGFPVHARSARARAEHPQAS